MTTVRKSLTADISVTNTDNEAGYAQIGLTVPVNLDAQQSLVDILGDEGWSLNTHSNGDTYLLRREHLNPGQTFTDEIDFRLDVNDYTSLSTQSTPGESVGDFTKWTSPEPLIEGTNSTIVNTANQILAANPGDVWAQARAAYDFPVDNFQYKPNMSSNMGAAWAATKDVSGITTAAIARSSQPQQPLF